MQTPVPDRRGRLLTPVTMHDLREPFYSSLQHWVYGDHADGDITWEQARAIGRMTGRLHDQASRWWDPDKGLPAMLHDEDRLRQRVSKVSVVVSEGLLTPDEWSTIEAAADRICHVMNELGRAPKMWGPVHGDLHQESLVFHEHGVSPIDFSCLELGHYVRDLGVTLYHLMHLDRPVRGALLEGYETIRRLPQQPALTLEAFLSTAAADNLAFQTTVPGQMSQPLFQRNLRHFANDFCRKLVAGEPFAVA